MRLLFLLLLSSSLFAQNATWKNFGPNQRLETAAKLCLDNAGNIYYIANGDTNQFPGSKWQLYKLDASGNVLWKKTYGSTGNFAAVQALYLDQKIFVVGERNWNDTTKAWVNILDTAGNVLKERFYGNGDTVLVGQDIALNNQNEIALLGQTIVQAGSPQGAQVLILDTALNVLHKHVQIDTNDFVAHEIVSLPTGGWVYTSDYEIANRFDFLVTKIDRRGNQVSRNLVSNGYTRGGNAIGLNSKGQVIIGGEGASAFSVAFDITLTVLDSNLNTIRDVFVRPGVVKNDACFDMAITPYDTYLFTGYHIDEENDNTKMIVVESDSLGNQLHIDTYGSSPSCIGSGLVCDANGNFVATGSDFNSAPSLIIALGQAKGLSLPNLELKPIDVYPNPSKGLFQLENPADITLQSVLNSAGQEVNFRLSKALLEIQEAPGIYYLHFSNGQVLSVMIQE